MNQSKLKQRRIQGFDDEAIRITVPAKVAFDLESMNKVTEIVLGRLGCPACHSGFDLRFDFERRFVFNEELEIERHV